LPLEKAGPYIQHNVLLNYLAELGLIGTGLFVIVLALWLGNAWSLWSDRKNPLWMRQYGLLFLAFFTNYFVNGMFHDVTLIPMMNMILYFLSGAVVAIRQDAEQNVRASESDLAGQNECLAATAA
jgi:O-antigen ligase